jgi:hypothetical protein
VSAGGAIRIASGTHCRGHEHPLFWNVSGPPGPRGARGIQGPPGTLSAFEAYRTTASAADLGTGATPVVTLSSLPAGAYVLSAHVQLDNHTDTNAAGTVTCTLVAGADSDSSYAYFFAGTDAAALPLSVTHTFSGQGTAQVSCEKQLSGSAFVESADLVATQVGHQTRVQVTG